LKSTDLICVDCNSTTGLLIDAAFAKFGNIFSSKYKITRESGETPNIPGVDLITGEPLIVQPGYVIVPADPATVVTPKSIGVFHYDRKRAIGELKKLAKQIEGMELNPDSIEFEVIQINKERQFLIDIAIEPSLLLRLGLSSRTVETHREKILEKTGAKNMIGVAVYAIRHRIYEL
jgi:hypothetical protein